MSVIASTPIDAEAKNATGSARLFFLDLSAGRILSANPYGSGLKTIINEGRKLPDGLALDVAAGHIYWTNMGDPESNDGSIMRSDLNGKNMDYRSAWRHVHAEAAPAGEEERGSFTGRTGKACG
jgi:hypothetical protein